VTITDNSHCQFLIYVSGAASHDIYVVGCNLDAVSGVNSIDVNSTGGYRVGCVGNRVVIKASHTTGTLGAGPSTGHGGVDRSWGYFACREVLGEGNKVYCDDWTYNGGVEIHGVEQTWFNNQIDGLYTAFAIVPPFTAGDNQTQSNVNVSGNQINRANLAIAMQLPSSLVGARGWSPERQPVITMLQGTGHHDSHRVRRHPPGGQRIYGGGVLDGLELIGNRVEFEPDTRASSTRYSKVLSVTQHGIA
jgi:hypothetical protein